MSNEHTQAPWIVMDGDDDEIHVVAGMRHRTWMESCIATVRSGRAANANAYLIAAAPALLEVLKSFCHSWDANSGYGISVDVQRALREDARAVIARAEGRDP